MEEIKIDEIHKEIDLIQACIIRMANNSFMIKGWLITIYAVVLALLPDKINIVILCVVMLMVSWAFWYLDAFFLRTEKIYRKIYDWILLERPKNNRELLYQLNPHAYEKKINPTESVFKIMFSRTLVVFYGIPILITLFIPIYSIFLPQCIITILNNL